MKSGRGLGTYSIDELLSTGLQFDAIVLVEIVEHVNDDILTEFLVT